MKLQRLALKNFRSIEDLVLEFPSYYTAVSGKNNSGKSNLLKALKSLFERETRFPFRAGESLNHSDDFPIWKAKDDSSSIIVFLALQIDRKRDSAVFKLATDFFNLPEETSDITLELTAEYTKNKDQPELSVKHHEEVLDSYKSRTMLKTISSAGAFQFHNSTEMETPFSRRTSFVDLIGEIAKADKDEIAKHRDRLSKAVAGVAKKHQREFSELLGRLEDKYTVALTSPKLNVDYLPIDIMLGDKNPGVSLEEWGSGTQNRTHILMTLFRAKKLSESLDENVKIAPVLVIEEPESFLHPSAQAEFGRVVQDLSEELQIQVIVATHSPYFLSHQKPESNVLLKRAIVDGKLQATERVPVSSGNWMEPFALNLGLTNPEFEPWKGLFFSTTDKILLVEGNTDREYFEMLRAGDHGSNKLDFDGEIYAYGGKDTLTNGVLLKFIKGRYTKFFVMYDLDAEVNMNKLFTGLDMEKHKHFCSVGLNTPGQNKIEGLLPESVCSSVYGKHASKVQQAMSGASEEAKSAKSALKKLLLEEFKTKAVPGQEYYGEFYKLTRIINKAMN